MKGIIPYGPGMRRQPKGRGRGLKGQDRFAERAFSALRGASSENPSSWNFRV
jgi:hypothetical protein